MKNLALWTVCVAILSGCAGGAVSPVSVGGSKADGTIVMGASVGGFSHVDWSGAEAEASKKCQAWGYSSAESFSGAGVSTRCAVQGVWGCAQYEATRTYQCIE